MVPYVVINAWVVANIFECEYYNVLHIFSKRISWSACTFTEYKEVQQQ